MIRKLTIIFFIIALLLTGCSYGADSIYSISDNISDISISDDIISDDIISYYGDDSISDDISDISISDDIISYYADEIEFDIYYEQIDTIDIIDERAWTSMKFPDHWHAWNLFALNDLRNDIVYFFNSTYNLNASWIDEWAWIKNYLNSENIISSVGL